MAANNLQDLIYALFEYVTSNTVSTEVENATLRSLGILGVKQPKIFFNSVHTFLLHNGKKMNEKEKAFVFQCFSNVLMEGNVLDKCDDQQILLIVNLSTQEMSLAKDVIDENGLANAAKEVLVTLAGKCNKFVNQIIDSLLSKFQPGSANPPHRFIILTLAEIAQKNHSGFVPFLHDILARTGSLLHHIKNDQIRDAFAISLCSFAESVKEFAYGQKRQNNTNADENDSNEMESEIHENFADQFETAYDIVINWPSSSKDHKCRADAAECVGKLCLMISKERILADLKKLDSMFRYLYKKAYTPEEQLAIIKGITHFLEAACAVDTIPIEHYLNDHFELLFPHVCLNTEQQTENTQSNMITIKIRNEVFRCFQVSSCKSADKEIYFILHKMQHQSETVRLGAINLLRHLLNSADEQMRENRSLITMGLKPFLTDELLPVRVKMSLSKLAVALADNEYIQNDDAGHQVMQFLLVNLIYRSDSNVKRSSVQQNATNEANIVAQLNSQCAKALYTISNTSKTAQELLWPLLFEYVCYPQYTFVITDLFKCLRVLCAHIRESGKELKPINFESNQRLPGPIQLMSRLLVFMNGAPLNAQLNLRAREAIHLFSELSTWFYTNFTTDSLATKLCSQLLKTLDSDFSLINSPQSNAAQQKTLRKTPSKYDYLSMEFKSNRNQLWQIMVLDMLCSLIHSVDDQEWRQNLAAAQAKQMNLFSSSSTSTILQQQDLQQTSHDKAFLMRSLGCTLSNIQCPNFIKEHLYLLFRQTIHSITSERVGCAMAMGHCASILDHTDLVLTELENISKWEHMKEKKSTTTGSSSAGIFSLIKDSLPYGRSVDVEILNLRATIVLSFGYVVFYCQPEGLILRLQNTVLPFLRQYTANTKEVLLRETHLEAIHLIAVSVHPSRLRDYRFESRYECLSYVKEYVNDEKSPETLSSWIRLLAAKATASLVLLEPPLSENEFLDISVILIQNIFPLCRERSGLKTLLNPQCNFGFSHVFTPQKRINRHQRSLIKSTNGGGFSAAESSSLAQPIAGETMLKNGKMDDKCCNKIEDDETSTVMEATVVQMRQAIANMVKMRPSVKPTINELIKFLYQYYGSEKDHERARSIDYTVLILQVYSEKADDCTLGVAKEFSPLSWLLGRLCPRLCDSFSFVRFQALKGIWLAFKISLLHRGHSPLDTDLVDSTIFNIDTFIDSHMGGVQEGRLDSNKCSGAILAISKEIEKRLPQTQVNSYVQVLCKMLSDRQGSVSSAAAQLLRYIITDRANSLHKEAEVLFINLLDYLARTRTEKIQTYTELLNGFTIFASHHLNFALQVLLCQSLPYNQTTLEVWEMMARVHFPGIIDYLLVLIRKNNVPKAEHNNALNSPQLQKNEQMFAQEAENDGQMEIAVEVDGEKQQQSLNSPTPLSPSHNELKTQLRPFNPSHFELINIGGGSVIKVVSDEACALISALNEVIKKGEPEEELLKKTPLLISALLQILVCLMDTQFSNAQKNANIDIANANQAQTSTDKNPKKEMKAKPIIPIVTAELTRLMDIPAKMVAEALKTLLTRINLSNVIERMNSERAWTNITAPSQYISAITSLCCALLDFQPHFIGPLLLIETEQLKLGHKNTSEAERIAAAIVLSSLITQCPRENGEFDSALFCTVYQALEEVLHDPCLIVRKSAIHGLARISLLKGPEENELIQRYSKRSLDAALAGLDDNWDRQDQLSTESIASLDSLARVFPPSLLNKDVLSQLLLKIRPCFEKENSLLRSNAFSLFGELGQTVGNTDVFREAFHNNIISIVLHLNDNDESVRNSCAKVLHICIPLINFEHAIALIEHEMPGGRVPPNYNEFLRQFGLILAISYPDRVNDYALTLVNYLRSISPRIRSNSVMLAGFLLNALTTELRATLSRDLIFTGLLYLLKDSDEQVRLHAISAISLLHDFV